MQNNYIVFHKYRVLKEILQTLKKVAVAFSGGVDSSLLLYSAGEVLGKNNVIALHGHSVLHKSVAEVEQLHKKHFEKNSRLQLIRLDPLIWPDFVNNDEKRCYHCKRRTYSLFLNYLKQHNEGILVDGTNSDDLSDNRPGLKALHELEVSTPLADAGLGKGEVRFLARKFQLSNHDKPSNSCLATRLAGNQKISLEKLRLVAEIEEELREMGFSGCRAKLDRESAFIELRQQNYERFCRKHNRIHVLNFCKRAGIKDVYLEISGRQ